ncbi:MAG: cation:H+ antiporter [Ilumatobacter sp.]|jgi:cation:H+ antiporter
MIALWSAAFVVGLIAASLASRRAVTHALRAADASQISSGFIGMTVMAIGTDLPEIANSIISAATGHGDLNVGDSAGSAVTQVTLVLGILCFSTRLTADRRSVAILGTLTAVALGAIGLLIRDGSFSRLDGTMLLLAWLVVVIAMKSLSGEQPVETVRPRQLSQHVARTGLWLVVVAVAATLVVQSFVAITETLGVPEILAGSIVLALGTSLPELIVDWTAIRRGAAALALGDLFGSSFLDATLAIGIGPTITPTAISAAAAAACFVAAAGMLAATAIATWRSTLGRETAVLLIGVYVAVTIGLVAVAS